jgi:outer membrane protein OmpA-like peptidoglycan-associated protein
MYKLVSIISIILFLNGCSIYSSKKDELVEPIINKVAEDVVNKVIEKVVIENKVIEVIQDTVVADNSVKYDILYTTKRPNNFLLNSISKPIIINNKLILSQSVNSILTSDDNDVRINELPKDKTSFILENNVIFFGVGSSNLISLNTINKHINFLKKNRNLKVILEGHSDNVGTPDYNVVLGERRANKVRQYMLDKGVGIDQMELVSVGEIKPIGQNKEKNRRVVIRYK